MTKIPDFSKLNLKGIMDNVKAMIGQNPIPEAAKDDPIGYRLSELSKSVKSLADLHTQEADEIAKLNTMLGELYQNLAQTKKPTTTAPETPKTPEPAKTPEKEAAAPKKEKVEKEK